MVLAAMTIGGAKTFPVPGQEAPLPLNQLSSESVFIAEPFSLEMLDKMESLLHSNMFQVQKPQLAALLYRYRRESGEAYLSKALTEKGNVTAAIVLAMNRDEKRLNEILEVYRGLTLQQEIEYSRGLDAELTLALGRWDHPRAVAALLAKQKLYPESADIAMALARRNAKEALPLLTKASAKAGWDDAESLKLKAALAKLTPQNSQRFSELMSKGYSEATKGSQPFSEFRKYALAPCITYMQDLRFAEVLIKEINTFYFGSKPANFGDHLFAIKELMKYSSDSAYDTLRKLFDKLPTRYKTEAAPFSTKMAVGQYLYQVRPRGDHSFIKKALGEKNLNTIKATPKLRSVPEGLLSFDIVLAHEF